MIATRDAQESSDMSRQHVSHQQAARRWMLIACTVMAVGLGPLSAQAPEPSPDPEALRAELRAYVADLRELPVALLEAFHGADPVSFDMAERGIELLTTEDLVVLHKALEQVPFWRSLPGILATSLPSEEYFSPLELAATLDSRLADFSGPEGFRDDLLSLIDRLGQTRYKVPAKSRAAIAIGRADDIKATVARLDDQQLMVLRQGLSAKLPEWREALERSRQLQRRRQQGGDKDLSDLINCPLATTSTCDDDFPDGVICELGNVIDEIVNLPCDVLDLAEEALDFIGDLLVDLFGLLQDAIPDADEVVELMSAALGVDLTAADWIVDYFSTVPPVAVPCPIDLEANPLEPWDDISLIGTMTTFDAQFVCQRNLQFINAMLADLVPDDSWFLALNLVFKILEWPIEYLCLCYEAAAEIQFDDDQAAHRTLVETNLDVTVSSRASQTSVDTLQADADDVGSDVDTLGSSVADLDADVAGVDDQVAVIDAKLDLALADSDSLSELLLDFEDLALQLRIEADLVRDGDQRVSLFQLPVLTGGYLETVQEILEAAIEQRWLAGRDVSTAADLFRQGNRLYSEQSYKKAYTEYRKAYRALVAVP